MTDVILNYSDKEVGASPIFPFFEDPPKFSLDQNITKLVPTLK